MHRTRTVVGLVLASAGIVFAIGLPRLREKHQTPAEYVSDEVATTEEAQEFDLMWTKLESLQKEATKLGPEQYKQLFLGSTTAYLKLDTEQVASFRNVVDEGLQRLEEARDHRTTIEKLRLTRQKDNAMGSLQQDSWSGESPALVAARRDTWTEWRDDQRETSDLLLSALQQSPRHDLLAERRLLWLLKLDFSLRDAQRQLASESYSSTR